MGQTTYVHLCSSDKAEIEWATSVAHLECGENDPGLAFCFASDAEIHAALAVGVPPVAQEIGNPQQSAHAFKLWLYNMICGIQPLASVPAGAGGPSMEMYQHLTTDEYQQFLNVIMAPPLSTWITAVRNGGGHLGTMYCITPRGRAQTIRITYAFP